MSSNLKSLGLVSEMHCVFSNWDLLSTSEGQSGAIAISCMFSESFRQPWLATQKKTSHVWYWVFVTWSLALGGIVVSIDEKRLFKPCMYMCCGNHYLKAANRLEVTLRKISTRNIANVEKSCLSLFSTEC